MALSRFICVLLVGAVFAANTLAGPVSDDDIKAGLIGSWINPNESPTQLPALPARQEFHEDGTSTLYIYESAECRVQTAAIEANWAVVDGVLITQVTGTSRPDLVRLGQIDAVEIVAMEPDRILLNADGGLHIWDKAESCHAPRSASA